MSARAAGGGWPCGWWGAGASPPPSAAAVGRCRRRARLTVAAKACFALAVQKMTRRTKKVGITGKYGTRYGASLRKIVRKIEVNQRVKVSACKAAATRARRPPATRSNRLLASAALRSPCSTPACSAARTPSAARPQASGTARLAARRSPVVPTSWRECPARATTSCARRRPFVVARLHPCARRSSSSCAFPPSLSSLQHRRRRDGPQQHCPPAQVRRGDRHCINTMWRLCRL